MDSEMLFEVVQVSCSSKYKLFSALSKRVKRRFSLKKWDNHREKSVFGTDVERK